MSALLAGQHALITGGGRGIGAAIARVLAGDGARVTLVGRDGATLDAAAQVLIAEIPGSEAHAVIADVSDAAAVAAAVAQARARLGPVHILINNAGQAGSAPFLKTDEAAVESHAGRQSDRHLSVHARGAARHAAS